MQLEHVGYFEEISIEGKCKGIRLVPAPADGLLGSNSIKTYKLDQDIILDRGHKKASVVIKEGTVVGSMIQTLCGKRIRPKRQ